jgi:hypothetical protein
MKLWLVKEVALEHNLEIGMSYCEDRAFFQNTALHLKAAQPMLAKIAAKFSVPV